MPLTPRERLRTALAHREPDRVPFDLGSIQADVPPENVLAMVAALREHAPAGRSA